MKSTSFAMPLSDFATQLSLATKQLHSLGVRVSGTRIARYEKVVWAAVESEKEGRLSHQSQPDFVNAVIEGSEIIDVASLDGADFASERVKKKLKEISSGAPVMTPTGHDPGRDYAFEFSTAARAKANGRLVPLPEVGDLLLGPDLWPAECKRISSTSQILSRIDQAKRQIEARCALGKMRGGVIILDVTRPLRVENGVIAAPDESTLMDTAERQMTRFMARNVIGKLDLDRIASDLILGVLVRYLAVGTAGDPGHIRRSTVWQACSLHPDEADENQEFLRVAEFLGPEPAVKVESDDLMRLLAVP